MKILTIFFRQIILCTLAFCLASSVSTAQDRLPQTVFNFGSMVPETSFTHKFQKRILTEAFRQNGWTFHLNYVPALKSLIEMVEKGTLDGDSPRGVNFAANGVHPGYVKIDQVLYSVDTGAYAKQSLPIEDWDSLAALNKRIGYVNGVYLHEQNLKSRISPENLIGYTTRKEGFAALANDDISVFVMVNHFNAQEMMRSLQFCNYDIKRLAILNKVDVCAYFSKKHEALAPIIAKTLQNMQKEGKFETALMETMTGQ